MKESQFSTHENLNKEKIDNYLRDALPESEPRIEKPMDPSCDISIVIPSFGEREYFFRPLESLLNQEGINFNEFEVIIVVNNSETPPVYEEGKDETLYKERLTQYQNGCKENQEVLKIGRLLQGDDVEVESSDEERHILEQIKTSGMRVYLVDKASKGKTLDSEKANVGGARNRGAAEAVERFYKIKKNGLIVQTDAEAAFQRNYLALVRQIFKEQPELIGCSGYIELKRIKNPDEQMKRVYFFADMQQLIKRIAQMKYPDKFKREKESRFSGANMVSRAFQTAYVGGVPEVGQKEDTLFKRRLDTLGMTARVPELITIPIDRISVRAEGDKSHGHGRQKIAQQSESSGDVIESITGEPMKDVVKKIVDEFCEDDIKRKNFERNLEHVPEQKVPSGIDNEFAELMKQLIVVEQMMREDTD